MTKKEIYNIITFFNKKYNKKEILDRYILLDFHIFYNNDWGPEKYVYLVYDKKDKKHKYSYIDFESNEQYYIIDYQYDDLEEFIEHLKQNELYDSYKIDLDNLKEIEWIDAYLKVLSRGSVDMNFYSELRENNKLISFYSKKEKENFRETFYFNSYIIDFFIEKFFSKHYIRTKEQYFHFSSLYNKEECKIVESQLRKLFKMKEKIKECFAL